MKQNKKAVKKKLDPEQKKRLIAQRRHTRDIRSIFSGAGFNRIDSLSGKEITFHGTTSDIDDMFYVDNIVVFIEYTITNDISAHLKKKYILYRKIIEHKDEFVSYCRESIPAFPTLDEYAVDHVVVKILYCVPGTIKQTLREELSGIYFFDLVVQNYFKKIVATIHKSARYELFAFFDLSYKAVADGVLTPGGTPSDPYEGSALPETSSSFPAGYKVVSFYVDPAALLPRAYVLRSEGWRDDNDVYQRMIVKTKIDSIREYLKVDKRVFVNNIIVTLPHGTKILDAEGNTVPTAKLVKTKPVCIQIPREFNSVGIVDGQHRVLSYHEGGKYDEEIAVLRKRQNLLATGIIYPKDVSDDEKARFEARLFLEINSTQTAAKSDLKQAIALLLTPLSEISLAKRVVNYMNQHGPLEGRFVRYSFETDKIKTTSIVSYGVRNVVKLYGEDSLYSIWSNTEKAKISSGDAGVADLYVKYCAGEINHILSALKENLPNERWTTDNKVPGRVLSTTVINGMVVCLRRIIEEGKPRGLDVYREKLKEVGKFKFGVFKSSQYGALGRKLFGDYFA